MIGMSKTITLMELGAYHGVVVAEGLVYTWGYNNQGQLGDGSTANKFLPVAVLSPILSSKNVTAIAAAGYYTLALTSGKYTKFC
jgi:alpha-tubulin suppressor-like RCC1 family protein